MNQKSYSIIIVPSDHSRTRQFRVTRTLVIVAGSLLLVLVAILTTFAVTHLKVLRTANEVGSLRAENEELRRDVAVVDDLARELEFLSAQRAQVLNMLGREDFAKDPAGQGPELAPGQSDPERVLGDAEEIDQLFAEGIRRKYAPRTWPTEGRVLREFLPEAEDPSKGLVLEVPVGEPVLAAGAGRVVEEGVTETGESRLVVDHGYGFRTVYTGFAQALVREGQFVERKQAIATFDTVGKGGRKNVVRSGGPALYFEIRVDGMPIDPREYLTPRQGRRRGS